MVVRILSINTTKYGQKVWVVEPRVLTNMIPLKSKCRVQDCSEPTGFEKRYRQYPQIFWEQN